MPLTGSHFILELDRLVSQLGPSFVSRTCQRPTVNEELPTLG